MTLTTGGTGTAPMPVGAADSRPQTTPPPSARAGRPGRIRRLWRGADTDPSWARPALLGLVVVAIVVAIGVWLLHWLYLRSSKERASVEPPGPKVAWPGLTIATP